MAAATTERLRWLRPLAALLVFSVAALVLHRELEQFHMREVFAHLGSIPASIVGRALLLTCASYWLLGCYDLLALKYARKAVSYPRTLFTAFIAYAFGHNLTLAGFTGAAVRLRLYASTGLTAIEIATVSGFCSITALLGLAALAGVSLLLEPGQIAGKLHLEDEVPLLFGVVLLCIVGAYVAWGSFGRRPLEIQN